MTFLVCPPWRKGRPVSPSPDRQHPGFRSQDPRTPQEPASANRSNTPQGRKQPESLSRKLRRRFSKESKYSKSSGGLREAGKVVFPFSFKPSRSASVKPATEITALEDYGSSLVSERGYDSDAQYITTPRRADILGRSPTSRGLRRMDLSDVIERSQERTSAERWALNQNSVAPESQESAFGMRFIPTPPSSLRGLSTPFHTPRGTADNQSRSVTALDTTTPQLMPGPKPKFMRSLPSLSSTATERGRSPSNHSRTMGSGNTLNNETIPSSNGHVLASRHGNTMASSGSMPAPALNLAVPKTRNLSSGTRSFTDPQLINLSEIGIPNRLVSSNQSSAPMSGNPSLAEVIHDVQQGHLMAPSQENLRIRQLSGASTVSGPENSLQRTALCDSSSCYSRGSVSPDSSHHDTKAQKQAHGKDVQFKPQMTDTLRDQSPILDVPDPKAEVYSRFMEHCNNSASPPFLSTAGQASGSVSPRKVSVGWMSGGKRVGYGYSVVPETEGGIEDQAESCIPQFNRPAGWKGEIEIADPSFQQRKPQTSGSRTPAGSVREHSPKDHNELPTVMPSNGLPHQYEATTFPRATNPPQRRNGYHVPPYMRGSMGNHSSREQESLELTDEQTSGSLRAPGLIPMVKVEHCEVPPTAQYRGQGNDNFTRQWARFNRSPNTSPRGQREAIPLGARAQDGAFSVDRLDRPDGTEPDSFETEIDAEFENEAEDQTTELQESSSRPARWVRRFSRHWEGRRFARHQQEPSNSSSSHSYHDCESNSPKRTVSTKSNSPVDLECPEMPGSFEGSRWAGRLSRLISMNDVNQR